MGRSPCCDKTGLKKGPWTPEEDLKLVQYVQINGPGNWRALPKNAGLQRCGKSCRLRWTNYLRPDIKRGRFSFEEEEAIIQLHSILGNKWSAIAARLPGRTDNEIKNYWNTHIRKRLLKMGIDPVTHSPRLDLLDLSTILHSAHLNLSNLLGLHTLVNPQLLSLATNLLASSSSSSSSHHENPEILLQKLQENQLLNAQLQENQIPFQSSKFQSPVQEAPPCAAASSGGPYASIHNQTQLVQGTDMGMGHFSTSSAELSCEDLINEGFAAMPSYGYDVSDQKTMDPSENSTIQSMNNGGQNFTFDSVMSTAMSSPTPFNSSSTFVNSGTEDERESYCCSMLKFEIPESLDFDDFM